MKKEDIEFLERDDGGDDDEASKFKYSLTGSDLKLPPVSEDGDKKERMRHIEKEEEEKKKREEEAIKNMFKEI